MSISNLINGSSSSKSYLNVSANSLSGNSLVASISSATQLNAGASGSLLYIPSAASAYNITTGSSLGPGFNCEVIVGSSSLANAVTLVFPASSLTCQAISGDATEVGGTGFTAGLATGKTNLIIGTGSKIGDRFLIFSPDGANFFCHAFINVHTSITST